MQYYVAGQKYNVRQNNTALTECHTDLSTQGQKQNESFLRMLSNQIQACVHPAALQGWPSRWATIIKIGFCFSEEGQN